MEVPSSGTVGSTSKLLLNIFDGWSLIVEKDVWCGGYVSNPKDSTGWLALVGESELITLTTLPVTNILCLKQKKLGLMLSR